MSEKISLTLIENQTEVLIREGKALELKEPLKVNFTGTIQSVVNYFEKRQNVCNAENSRVEYDYEAGTLKLIINEKNHYHDTIQGKIQFSKEYEQFGINTDKLWSPEALVKFLKMNKQWFPDNERHLALVGAVQKNNAKINSSLEKEKDDRGNKTDNFNRTVETNIPVEMTLQMKLFKGSERVYTFIIEIGVDATDTGIRIWFMSPELAEIINIEVKETIDAALAKLAILPQLEY